MRTRRVVRSMGYALRKRRAEIRAAFGTSRPSNKTIKSALKLAREMER